MRHPTVHELVDALGGRKEGTGFRCRCPVHGGKSLIVSQGDSQTVWVCMQGCEQQAVTEAIRAMFPDTDEVRPKARTKPADNNGQPGVWNTVATYDYELDGVAYQKSRQERGDEKKFMWRKKGENKAGLKQWDARVEDMPLYVGGGGPTIDPNVPVYFVEGEKTADAVTGSGGDQAVCLAGGASQKDFGTALEALRNCKVRLWPDNDNAGRGLMQRLAEALDGVAAGIRKIEPVGDDGSGHDAADFLAKGGDMAAVTTSPYNPKPVLREEDGMFEVRLESVSDGTLFNFTELAWAGRGLSALLEVEIGPAIADRHSSVVNIDTSRGRSDFAKDLTDYLGDPPGGGGKKAWKKYVAQACRLVSEAYRKTDPSIDLALVPIAQSSRMALEPLLAENQANLIFGDGGSMKTFTSLLMAMNVAYGQNSFGGEDPDPGTVMFVDYETDVGTIATRERDLLLGHGLKLEPNRIRYWPTGGMPLSSQVSGMARVVKREDIKLVIIDSAAAACGGDPEKADSALQFFNALTRLETTTLTIAHIRKDQTDKHKAFGSTFWHNQPRTTWFLERVGNGQGSLVTVRLKNRKASDFAAGTAIKLRFQFRKDPDKVVVEMTEDAHPDSRAPALHIQIRRELKGRGPMSTMDLARLLGTTDGTVRSTLNRHREAEGFYRSDRGEWNIAE